MSKFYQAINLFPSTHRGDSLNQFADSGTAAVDIVETLKDDYSRFPKNQTYSLYAEDVYFKDPMNQFRGCDRYRQMIGFIDTWFINPKMDLHEIQQTGNQIRTEWTLSWNTPLPWQPRIAIPGWSELELNQDGLICSHIDYWHCSKLDVVKQHFFPKDTSSANRTEEKPID